MKNKKMKIARLENDMNQQQLADAVGVTRQTISMIESGNYNPTLNLCIAICRALGKTLDQLFWSDEEGGE
ncbi:MAG: helix-turn-helix transcriptional regulator [Ruminococcus sp.]|nr:helix-turn-helix transcriptional regulator [Ruminococcus sp.]